MDPLMEMLTAESQHHLLVNGKWNRIVSSFFKLAWLRAYWNAVGVYLRAVKKKASVSNVDETNIGEAEN